MSIELKNNEIKELSQNEFYDLFTKIEKCSINQKKKIMAILKVDLEEEKTGHQINNNNKGNIQNNFIIVSYLNYIHNIFI